LNATNTRRVPIIQFKGKTAVESYHRVVPHHTLEIDAKLSLAKKPSLDGKTQRRKVKLLPLRLRALATLR